MSGLFFDPSKTGLRKVLKGYEELEFRFLWSVGGEGAGSKAVMEAMNEGLGAGGSGSRAAIILSLNRLVDLGVLGFWEETSRGGMKKIYYSLMDESEFLAYILRTMIESVMMDFPKESREILEKYNKLNVIVNKVYSIGSCTY